MPVQDFMDRLDKRLDRFEERQVTSDARADSMALVQQEQKLILAEHIRRTAANESLHQLLREEFDAHRKDSVTWTFLGKLCVAVGGLVAFAEAITKLIEFARHAQ